MVEEKKRVVKKSWREKGWYDIVAPPMFGSAKIGETLASDPSQLPGRVFETTLGDLIEDFSRSHIKLYFQVKGIEEGRALTSFIGHDMARDYIRSQIRRRATRIGDISTVTTQDGHRLRVSSIVTTLRRVQSSQLEAIRRDMRKVIEACARERTFDQFVQEVVLGKLAADIYKAAKRYCPVKRVEVWKTKVLTGPA
jgi:small subunit ribosomal protein S3Ae